MIIEITLNDFKEIIASSKIIGKTFENKATILKFNLTDEIATKNFYLDIEKPDGAKFTTSQLTIVNKIVEYEVPNTILDLDGFLKIEVILTDTDNYQMKYPALLFKVEKSINASDNLPNENQTILSQIQEVLDLVDTTGDGTKYLSDDGTYKTVSGGTTDYNTLNNKPIMNVESLNYEEPVILRNLQSGIYNLHGYILPYSGSADLFAAQTPIQANVARAEDMSFVQLFFSFNNQLQYFEITDNSYTYKDILFNELTTSGDRGSYDDTEVRTLISDNTSNITNLETTKADKTELFSKNYNDLTNKPTIPTVPTDVSAFTNDAGYLTSHQDISSLATKAELQTTNSNIATNTAAIATKANIADVYTKADIDNMVGDMEALLGGI